MKKILITMLSVLVSIIMWSGVSKASDSDLFLNVLQFEAQIQEDGSMDVTEYWDIDIEETNTLYKTFKADKSKYSSITNVKVTDITNGQNIQFTEVFQEMYHVTKNCYYGLINEKGMFEIAWGVGLDNSSANRKYKIEYTVNDAIAKYQDKAELYWQFVGADFEVNAQKVLGTITLPQNVISQDEIRVWGHTEDLNGEIHVVDSRTIEFEVNGRNRGKYIEVRTLFPTEMITTRMQNKKILQEVIAEETVWAEEANQKRANRQMMKNVVVIGVTVISAVLSVFLLKSIFRKAKEAKSLNKIKPSQEMMYFREMPREDATPAEALYLIKKQTSTFMSDEIGKIFSATLLDLGLKKCLSFEVIKNEKGKENIYIEIKKKATVTLTKEEIAVLEFLLQACGEKDKISVKELEKYIQKSQTKVVKLKDTIDKWIPKRLQEIGLEDEKQKEEYKKYSDQIVGGFFGLFFSFIIGAIVASEFGAWVLIGIIPLIILQIINLIVTRNLQSKINVFTQNGIDEIEKWKGLKKYMQEFSLLKEKEVPDLVIWEKFLVYATVFGIADKVIKQLKIVYPNMEEISDINNYTYLYFMMHTNFSTSFSNSVSTSMTSSYSSATGGGGGFSGGGGGGGGRRWRRRTLNLCVLQSPNFKILVCRLLQSHLLLTVFFGIILISKKQERRRGTNPLI